MVKKISASILQCIDIAMFTGGHAKARVASLETTEGCPIAPGSSLQKVSYGQVVYQGLKNQTFGASHLPNPFSRRKPF